MSSGSGRLGEKSSSSNGGGFLLEPPRGAFGPVTHCFFCPSSGFVLVTGRARIRNLVSIGHRWREEAKRMGMNKGPWNAFRLNLRHVARYALASRTAVFMMRVFFERSGVRPVR